MDLLKKNKIKSVNNKMAISAALSTIESKKQTKHTRRAFSMETESWIWRVF